MSTIKAWYLRAMPARVSPSSTKYLRILDNNSYERNWLSLKKYEDKTHLVLRELLTRWNLSNCWQRRCMCRSCAEKSNLPVKGVHLVPWARIIYSNSAKIRADLPKLTWQGFRHCNCVAQSFLVQKRSHLHPGKNTSLMHQKTNYYEFWSQSLILQFSLKERRLTSVRGRCLLPFRLKGCQGIFWKKTFQDFVPFRWYSPTWSNFNVTSHKAQQYILSCPLTCVFYIVQCL